MKTKGRQIKVRGKKSNPILSSREDALLIESAKIASSKAVRSSTALGITIKIIKDHKIIAIKPDKSSKVLRTISKSKIDITSLKKGMILERR